MTQSKHVKLKSALKVLDKLNLIKTSVYYTDYPFAELGDEAYKKAPIRKIRIISYDGNKYCKIKVKNRILEVKSGYIYDTPRRK